MTPVDKCCQCWTRPTPLGKNAFSVKCKTPGKWILNDFTYVRESQGVLDASNTSNTSNMSNTRSTHR